MSTNNYYKPQQSLPNSTSVLILGILSLIFSCGFIGLILGIIALSLSNKDKTIYESNPGNYSLASNNNMNAGRICAIIGISLSAVMMLIFILYLLFVGTLMTGIFSMIR